MRLKKIYDLLILLFLFLLPWQTRYIWYDAVLNGGHWEYGTFSIYGTEILVWIILILFFIQNFLKKEVWFEAFKKRNIFSLIFIFCLVLTAVSVLLSTDVGISYYYIFHVLEALALVVVLMNQQQTANHPYPSLERRGSDWYLVALWLGGIVQGGLAIYQFLTQGIFASKWLGMASQQAMQGGASVVEFADQRWLRAYGSFGSPNSLGIYLAVLFIIGFILYFTNILSRFSILLSAGQILIVSGLLLSFSRGAWLATAAGIVSLFIFLFYKQKQLLPVFFKQIIFALAVIVFWLSIFYPIFAARFNTHNRLEAQSIAERQGQYAEAVSFIKINPLFGVGPGAYTEALHKKYPNLSYWLYQPVHNIYLLTIVEMGILGALMMLLIIGAMVKIIIKNNVLYAPVLVCLFFTGLFDHWLISMFTGVVFVWIVLALGNKKIINTYEGNSLR